MQVRHRLFVSVLTLVLVVPAFSQQSPRASEIPGFYNPVTKSFRPQLAEVSPDAASTATTYTGELEFEFTINLETPVPSNEQVECEISANVFDASADITEEASTHATVKSNMATCTVKIPYSWALLTASTDRITISAYVAILPTSTTTLSSVLTREHTQTLPSISVPKTGTTTVSQLNTTI